MTDPTHPAREVDRVLRRRSTDFPVDGDAASRLPARSSKQPAYPWTEIGEKERRAQAFLGEADTHEEVIVDAPRWWQRLEVTTWDLIAFLAGGAVVLVAWWLSR